MGARQVTKATQRLDIVGVCTGEPLICGPCAKTNLASRSLLANPLDPTAHANVLAV